MVSGRSLADHVQAALFARRWSGTLSPQWRWHMMRLNSSPVTRAIVYNNSPRELRLTWSIAPLCPAHSAGFCFWKDNLEKVKWVFLVAFLKHYRFRIQHCTQSRSLHAPCSGVSFVHITGRYTGCGNGVLAGASHQVGTEETLYLRGGSSILWYRFSTYHSEWRLLNFSASLLERSLFELPTGPWIFKPINWWIGLRTSEFKRRWTLS
jgi:hypothetical protein